MERYRIPKRKVRVRIRPGDGQEENVFLFLADFAEGHVGAERPSDLFSESSDFRAAERENGELVFLQRANVWLVIIDLEDELDERLAAGDPGATNFGPAQGITVVLEDGLTLTGAVRYELPEARARVQDFLNTPAPFLPLYQGEEIVLINKSRIARVTLAPMKV